MIDLRKGLERRSVVLLIPALADSSTNAVHPHAPVFHPRLPVRGRFTASGGAVTSGCVDAAACAPLPAEICGTGAGTRRSDHRSVDVMFVSTNTSVSCMKDSSPAGGQRVVAILRRRHPGPAL